MGIFSTRNSDGASSLAESCNTVSSKEMKRIKAVAVKHNQAKQEVFTDEAVKYRKAHRIDKAGTN